MKTYLEKLLNPDRPLLNVWPLVEVFDFGQFGVAHLADDHDNMQEYDLAGNSKQNSKYQFKVSNH